MQGKPVVVLPTISPVVVLPTISPSNLETLSQRWSGLRGGMEEDLEGAGVPLEESATVTK
jgi:hypothetical protein